MDSRVGVGRLVAAAILTAGCTGTGAALLRLALTFRLERVDDVVAAGAVLLGALVLAWYALTGLVACLVLLTRLLAGLLTVAPAGSRWRSGEAWLSSYGAPLVRRLAVAGMVTSVSVGAVVPAWAAGPAGSAGPVVAEADTGEGRGDDGELPIDLGWPVSEVEPGDAPGAPTADSADPADPAHRADHSDAAATPAAHTGERTEPRRPAPSARHVVERGDSLWTITRELLRDAGEPAATADIAAAWPRLYEANARLIGPDPGLILPGQELHIPPFEEER